MPLFSFFSRIDTSFQFIKAPPAQTWCPAGLKFRAGGAIITSEKKEKKKGKREKGGKRKRKEKRGGDCLCHIAFLCRWSPWALSVAVAVCSSPSQRRTAARELSTIHSRRLVTCAPELDRRTRGPECPGRGSHVSCRRRRPTGRRESTDRFRPLPAALPPPLPTLSFFDDYIAVDITVVVIGVRM